MAKQLKFSIYIVIVLFVAITSRYIYFNIKESINSVITFETLNHNFDTIIKPEQAELYFRYKNTGNKFLEIYDIQTTCGCTIPFWNTRRIQPKEEDSFLVKYHTQNKGNFVKEIMVYSNALNSPTRLKISGYVPYGYKTE
ncbi:DUF1573 domain-containing protein [Flavobacteriaceae bacterium 14752]|uniref:DUF1573 domain-containing protein n=1 Tax=Mesohalobacter salilacus TaxID=2491711 RepID=UPI000F63F1F0|nr:DUF1573 domain-containing protein [Flavobacteriaceae bacterium 14752]